MKVILARLSDHGQFVVLNSDYIRSGNKCRTS